MTTRTVSLIFRYTDNDCWGDIKADDGEVRPEPGEQNYTNVLWVRNVPSWIYAKRVLALIGLLDGFQCDQFSHERSVSLGEFEWEDLTRAATKFLSGESTWTVLPITVLERNSPLSKTDKLARDFSEENMTRRFLKEKNERT